jgi:hypothetical protein
MLAACLRTDIPHQLLIDEKVMGTFSGLLIYSKKGQFIRLITVLAAVRNQIKCMTLPFRFKVIFS